MGYFSVSQGVLAYRRNVLENRELVWLDTTGKNWASFIEYCKDCFFVVALLYEFPIVFDCPEIPDQPVEIRDPGSHGIGVLKILG